MAFWDNIQIAFSLDKFFIIHAKLRRAVQE